MAEFASELGSCPARGSIGVAVVLLLAAGCSSSPPASGPVECGEECLEQGRCDDGLDDDDDGLVDCEDDDCDGDPACWSYGGECATATIATSAPGPWQYGGTLPASGTSFGSGSCGGSGAEVVVAFTAPRAGTYGLHTTSPDFPVTLYVRKGVCLGKELACHAADTRSRVSVVLKADQTAFVFVDSEPGASGSFVLTIDPPPAPPDPFCSGALRCGVGECAREVAPCVNGVHQTCEPGQPSAETCDGFDNDCNGQIDDAPDCAALPPDPSTVAPPLDPTIAPSFAASIDFLYTGDHPIQRGVRPGTIEAERAAVLHGHLGDRSGGDLGGVRVSVHGRPDLGFTLTRADGKFDLVVNGGGTMVVDYSREGYFPAQRQAEVPWHEHVYLADAVLVAPDANVTTIDLASSTTVQVAEGSPVTDRDGTRRATILFPPGTEAELLMPDGTRQPVAALSVRATEYTVGPTGPAAMPAKLPPTSAYTYAVDLTADEALAAGAEHVMFSRPVPLYVENFLHFPVGTGVPVGYYDKKAAVWVALDNGVVLTVTGVGANGEAELDLDGDGAAEDAGDLELEARLGIDGAEKTRLGELYQPGTSLWRALIPHFTLVDLNWDPTVPDGTTAPDQPDPDSDEYDEECCQKSGSIIEAQNRSVGEVLPVFGTPYMLYYDSSRVLGRKDGIDIPLIGETVPPHLARVDLNVYVAGRLVRQSFAPRPNLRTRFSWDGRDVYGREVSSPPLVSFQVQFAYPAEYNTVTRFAAVDGTYHTQVPGREELVLERTTNLRIAMTTGLPTLDGRAYGFGGFSLSPHHLLAPEAGVLFEGGGKARHAVFPIAESVAGPGDGSSAGEGVRAVTATIAPSGLTFDGAGNLYVADANAGRVRKVDRAGLMTTVAGGRPASPFDQEIGDGGPATAARLVQPRSVAVDGSGNLYIAESAYLSLDPRTRDGFGQLTRIRKVTPDGRIQTIAGGFGPGCIAGDHVLAKGACLPSLGANGRGPHLAVDATGHLFVGAGTEIRRIDPDGLVATVAGGPHPGFAREWAVATADYSFGLIDDLAVDLQGNLIVADDGHRRLRRIDARTWTVRTIAGCGPVCVPRSTTQVGVVGACRAPEDYPSDGVGQWRYGCTRSLLATNTPLDLGRDQETSIAVGRGNVIYVRGMRPGHDRVSVWKLAADGSDGGNVLGGASSYATARPYHDGINPVAEDPNDLTDLAVSPKDELVVARPDVVRRVRQTSSDLIPALDGSALYHFDSAGRHLETLSPVTGARRHSFGYDARGWLTSVTDGDGNVTRIDRDAAGKPTQIIAPTGQVTHLTVNADGYLSELTDPAGGTYRMTYHGQGLLETFTKPSGDSSRMTYDEYGTLVSDLGASGGGWASFERTGTSASSTITVTSASAEVTRYGNSAIDDSTVRTTILPDGSTTVRVVGLDHEVLTLPDGRVITTETAPDPELGRLAPVIEGMVTRLPSGMASLSVFHRQTTPSPTGGLIHVLDTSAVNDNVFTREYQSSTHTWTETSPEGRVRTTVVDEQERPIEISVPGYPTTRLTWGSNGKVISASQTADGETRTITMDYETSGPGAGYVRAVTDALGNTTTYTHDARGASTSVTSAEGRVTTFAYDASANLTSVTPPGRPPHTFGWTPRDRLALYQPPSVGAGDWATRQTFDSDDRLVEIARPGGAVITPAYNRAGQLAGVTTPDRAFSYTYDGAGRVTALSSPAGDTIVYGYDGPLVTSVTASGRVAGQQTLGYDRNFRVVSDTVVGAGQAETITLRYDHDGLVTDIGELAMFREAATGQITGTELGGVSDQVTHDGFGAVSGYSADWNGSGRYAVSFQRDAVGRVVQAVETVEGATATESYRYDRDGRLVGVDRNGARVAEYTYDDNGNRLSVEDQAGVHAATYDAQDRLVSFDGDTFTYTAWGDLATRTSAQGDVTTYTYDTGSNLRAVALPGGSVVEYLVDPAGHRIGKVVDGTRVQSLLYGTGPQPIAELDAAGNVTARFVYAARVPAYIVKGAHVYFVVADVRGSVRLVVDVDTGVVAQRLDYDPWGRVLRDTSPGFQPFGYAGGLYDPSTGLVRFGARDYDPTVGRWTTKDPALFGGGDTNLYAYVGNGPIWGIDPSGLSLINLLPVAQHTLIPGMDVVHFPYFNEMGMSAPDGSIVVSGHGTGDHIATYPSGVYGEKPQYLDANKIAEMIKNQPDYSDKTTIVISACTTGKPGGLADQLSKLLPNKILAPVGLTSTNPITGGTSVDGGPYGDNYKVFNGDPKGPASEPFSFKRF